MKLITAIIKPFKLHDVRYALSQFDIKGMTITEVKGFGRQKGHVELYRGADYVLEMLHKLRLEVVIDDVDLPQVIDAMARAARTGRLGDGKIFVSSLEQVIRIRTGERGLEAV